MKRIITILAVAVIAAVAAWLFLNHSPEPPVTTRDSASIAKPVASDAVRAFSFQWTEGAVLSYALRYEVRSQAPNAADDSLAAPASSLSGMYHLRVLQVTPQGVTLGAQFAGVQMLTGGERRSVNMEHLLNETAFIVKLSPKGRIEAVTCLESLANEDRDLLTNIVANAQIILPPDLRQTQWTMNEDDANGTSSFHYAFTGANEITKRRTFMRVRQDCPFAVTVTRSLTVAKVGASWLQSLDSHEVMAISMEGRPVNEVSVVFTLTLVEGNQEMPVALRQLDAASALNSLAASPDRHAHTRRIGASELDALEQLKAKYASISLAESLKSLHEAISTARSHADTVGAINALADNLRAYPQKALELVEALRDTTLADGLTSRAIHALELSGASTVESQAALAQILAHPDQYSPEVVSQAAVAAGGVGEIRDSALPDALRNLAAGSNDEFLRDAAVLALGKLGGANEALREELASGLVNNLGTGPDHNPEDIQVSLWSLANGRIHSPEILEKVSALLHHEEAPVRAAAVEYLGVAAPEEARSILAALADPSVEVRAAAVTASLAGPKPPEAAVSAVLKVLNDPAAGDALRATAVDALAAQLKMRPEIVLSFQRLLGTTLSGDLRDHIRVTLDQARASAAQ